MRIGATGPSRKMVQLPIQRAIQWLLQGTFLGTEEFVISVTWPFTRSNIRDYYLWARSKNEAYKTNPHTHTLTQTQGELNLLKKKRNPLYIWNQAYRAVNTSHHGYKNQSVNDV